MTYLKAVCLSAVIICALFPSPLHGERIGGLYLGTLQKQAGEGVLNEQTPNARRVLFRGVHRGRDLLIRTAGGGNFTMTGVPGGGFSLDVPLPWLISASQIAECTSPISSLRLLDLSSKAAFITLRTEATCGEAIGWTLYSGVLAKRY